MSTFNGLVKEFPRIRIDYFRNHPNKPAPAALFLSHVHSDHLMGLESVKMPFVYCSSTTRRILLKMEKYPHRINFAKGVLEARKQHYKHLKTVLREIPVGTATELELGPKSSIRVTLLDANHCPGAVMFLIEGDGKAILYTGDVRAESWWVNSIAQNPLIVPYTCDLKHLDCIYLDTTFATHDKPYRDFQTKAEGLKELLDKVGRRPPDTIFYFRAWTLGYENAWIALSNFLRSKIHVNQYQMGIFSDGNDLESTALTGFTLGNSQMSGCLTNNEAARIHSCEPGLSCHSKIKNLPNVVWISPIISRLADGTELRELGAGGGWKDLYPTTQFKLEEAVTMQQLSILFGSLMSDNAMSADLTRILRKSGNIQDLYLAIDKSDDIKVEADSSLRLEQFLALLAKTLQQENSPVQADTGPGPRPRRKVASTDTIHFPYSRHSSHNELRHLVSIFRPNDICPCTVSPETWSEELSMESLFGDLCRGHTFHYDQETRDLVAEVEERRGLSNAIRGKRKRDDDDEDSQKTQSQNTHYHDPSSPVVFTSPVKPVDPEEEITHDSSVKEEDDELSASLESPTKERASRWQHKQQYQDPPYDTFESQPLSSSAFDSQPDEIPKLGDDVSERAGQVCTSPQIDSETPMLLQQERDSRKQARIEAYNAARLALLGGDITEWDAVPLRSVGHGDHIEAELEL